MLYFEYVAQRGPLLHILMTDLYMAGHIDLAATRVGQAILRRLVRLVRAKTLKLSKKEILAAIEMIAAIPEEAGSLAYYDELAPATARKLCHALLLSSVRALRSPGRVTRHTRSATSSAILLSEMSFAARPPGLQNSCRPGFR